MQNSFKDSTKAIVKLWFSQNIYHGIPLIYPKYCNFDHIPIMMTSWPTEKARDKEDAHFFLASRILSINQGCISCQLYTEDPQGHLLKFAQ